MVSDNLFEVYVQSVGNGRNLRNEKRSLISREMHGKQTC